MLVKIGAIGAREGQAGFELLQKRAGCMNLVFEIAPKAMRNHKILASQGVGTGARGSFPSDEAAIKLLFLGLRSITKRWSMPVNDCNRPQA
jgi:hypothetical protein